MTAIEKDVEDIAAVKKCNDCGWSPAAIIMVDGNWECYNCGGSRYENSD